MGQAPTLQGKHLRPSLQQVNAITAASFGKYSLLISLSYSNYPTTIFQGEFGNILTVEVLYLFF